MNRSTPPSCGATAPVPDDHDEQQGLLPGLLATIRNYRSVPPERALFRELLSSAVGRSIETYVVGGLKISASSIKLVAWSLFGRMNTAGILVDDDGRPFSRETFARDASLSKRAVRAALGFLKQARVIAVDPASGPHPEVIRINVGGLDWSAVRRRVRILIGGRSNPDSTADQQPLLLYARGEAASPLNGARGEAASPHEGYVRRGQISVSIAAAGTPRARETERRQQEQQQRRIEGLFAAIAARARRLGHDFDEANERRRIADGAIDVAALQALADDLDTELAEQGDVRRHRITPGLDGGGKCAVCGRRALSETELCPGRPRRTRIQALVEDCAPAAATTAGG